MRARGKVVIAMKMLGACVALSSVAVYVSAQTAPTATPAKSGAGKGQTGQQLVVGGLGESGDIKLLVNKSVVLTTATPYRRLSVGQPDIFEANAIGQNKI